MDYPFFINLKRFSIESLLKPESSKDAKGNSGIGCLSLSDGCVCPIEQENNDRKRIRMNGLIYSIYCT